jgi:hypothetical protein
VLDILEHAQQDINELIDITGSATIEAVLLVSAWHIMSSW